MSWLGRKRQIDSLRNGHPLTHFDEVIYAVGDVHGRCDLLNILLAKTQRDFTKLSNNVSFDLTGKIVFLGDYIDRGPDSRGVLELLMSLNISGLETVFLKGNHEAVMLEALRDPEICRKWIRHGGDATMQSYGVFIEPESEIQDIERAQIALREKLPHSHRSFLEKLLPYYRTDTLLFVHAGVDPDKPIQDQSDEEFLWVRDKFLKSRKLLPFVVVHGHTPQTTPSWDGRRIGLDTGAYFSNLLNSAKIQGSTVDFLST